MTEPPQAGPAEIPAGHIEIEEAGGPQPRFPTRRFEPDPAVRAVRVPPSYLLLRRTGAALLGVIAVVAVWAAVAAGAAPFVIDLVTGYFDFLWPFG